MRKKTVILTLLLLMSIFWCSEVSVAGLKSMYYPERIGCKDVTGKVVIEAKYEKITLFQNGLAVARLNGKDGYIDTKGKTVIPFQFNWASNFSEGLARINVGGKVETEYPEYEPSGGQWSYINGKGQVVIETNFPKVWNFSNGLAKVLIDSEKETYGYIDKTGKLAFPYDFEECFDFTEDVAWVKYEGLWYLLNKAGSLKQLDNYVPIAPFLDGVAPVKVINKVDIFGDNVYSGECYLDKNLINIFGKIFESAQSFSEGRGLVLIKDKWGCIDTSGQFVIPAKYARLYPFYGGLALFGVEVASTVDAAGNKSTEYKYGYLDKSGKIVIPAQYKNATDFYDGLAQVDHGTIDKNGKIVVKAGNFDSYWRFSQGLVRFKTKEYWTYVDENGKDMFPQTFLYTGEFSKSGLSLAHRKDKGWGYIDRNGKTVIPFEYASLTTIENGIILGSKSVYIEPMSILVFNERGQMVHNFSEMLKKQYTKSFLLKDTYSVLAEAGLNMRKKPALNGEKIMLIPYGAQVKILEKTDLRLTIDGITGLWVKVDYKGQTGYIFDGYLSRLPAPDKTKSDDDYMASLQGKVTSLEYEVESWYVPYYLGETGVIKAALGTSGTGMIDWYYYIPGITLREGFILCKLWYGSEKVTVFNGKDKSCLVKDLSFPGENVKSIDIESGEECIVCYSIYKGENGYIIIRISLSA